MRTYILNNRGKGPVTEITGSDLKLISSGYKDKGNVYVFTPSTDFSLSEIKTQMEAGKQIFNDSHIIVELGANNFVCTIDTDPDHVCTITRKGTGSLSFDSVKTLNSGVDNITIMNGNESSIALIQCRATTDYLTIRNK